MRQVRSMLPTFTVDTKKDKLEASLPETRSLAVTGNGCRPVMGEIITIKNVDTGWKKSNAALPVT